MLLTQLKPIIAIALLPVLLLALVACGEDTQTPYRIGVMESLTGPGETYGTMASQVKQMALDEINAAGGVNGRHAGVRHRGLAVQRAGRNRRVQEADRRGRHQDYPRHFVQRRDARRGPPRRGGQDHPVLRGWRVTPTSPTPATTSSAPR